MIARLILAAALTPFAVHAQISLFVVDGSTETPVTTVYGFGQVAQGDTKDVLFRARNNGASALTVTKLAMSGIGFAIVNTAIIPFTVAPGSALDFTMRFTGGPVGPYTANLQVNTQIVLLLATIVAGPTVGVAAPCTGPDSQRLISFGRVQQGGQVTCTFTLQNPFTQALIVSPITVSGAAFSATQASSASIPAGQFITFTVRFTAATMGTFNGTLTAGPRVYSLSGTGFSGPLPAPIFTFDAATFLSGQQHTLSMRFAQPSTVDANGALTMAFTPTGSVVSDDSAIQFTASGKRVIPFSIAQGASNLVLNTQANVIFSTGTTAGKITFTLESPAFGISGAASTSITIAGAPMTISSSSATRRVNDLDISIWAFDNTYSAGRMDFTFNDAGGNPVAAAITADFTSAFSSFFRGQILGSAFLVRMTFPVTGDPQTIRSVDVTVANSAGNVRLSRLNFP